MSYLQRIWFSPEALIAEIVSYLERNPNNHNDTPLDFYMIAAFSNYLNRMSVDGTLGAEITLRAVANWLVSNMSLFPLSAE